MSEQPDIHYINIRELALSSEQVKSIVDKAVAYQADRLSHNPFRRIRALRQRYRMWRYMHGGKA